MVLKALDMPARIACPPLPGLSHQKLLFHSL